jgi:hypothetical protein
MWKIEAHKTKERYREVKERTTQRTEEIGNNKATGDGRGSK